MLAEVTPSAPTAAVTSESRSARQRATNQLTNFLSSAIFVALDTPEHSFCGDIDGVPLGQRGVLPGPTQINRRASSEGKVVGCSTGPMLARLDHATKHYAISTHPKLP
ncbi:unnamed protein product [Pieris brassicae]|uniref:Uncharacterized protein n=1 Tax=Pieris brassicae TaxID=7116 RepID=A0A9P0T134_PIEBR|nr:unnamed protein product [Pieris brassicae]